MGHLILKFYPFLKDTWKIYESMDEAVEGTNDDQVYINVCKGIKNTKIKDNEKYYNLCLKLSRNLKIFCSKAEECKTNSIYCQNLNSWLYKIVNEQKLDSSKIYGIFMFFRRILHRLGINDMCTYYDYGRFYLDPINIIMLKIFDANMNIIEQTLSQETYTYTCPCQNFVSEIIKIYKNMNNKYCTNGEPKYNIKRCIRTCDLLKNFAFSYNQYLHNNNSIKRKIPSLTSQDDVEYHECEEDYDTSASLVVDEEQLLLPENDDLLEDDFDQTLSELQDFETNNLSSFKIKFLPTALVIIAGVSSLFFLSYKFTPIRNLFSNRKRIKTTKNTYNEDEEKEFFYNMPDNITSYNQRYDIAYGNL
ncbi:variable surface protein [Plasmodium gonderi]|uniref:Variable surface protein n=1 Tax=Plasmodium gonderi TaxID=77519 RepID=A0A1Y1JV73_PLAGO|nr:variable surface protein [Plasmodium gonderi]GAW84642.1 variable surface protein [Plasmodium gonderi]